MRPLTFHLLGNAHLDPVWFWDWREGLNEGLTTVRTLLDLMEERPEMTLIRGEALIYQFVEEQDPATFARLRAMVAAGRWDVVGGTWIQPDTNMPATESLVRQYLVGQTYFRSRFGKAPRIAWTADSFGHSAGLPEIYAQAGIQGLALTRPGYNTAPERLLPFWWESPGGSRILVYRPLAGWYGCDRQEIFARCDALRAAAEKEPMRNVGVFYGIGNHGGGPTRRQLEDIQRWADKNPEVTVVHSGLHRFFDALQAEEPELSGGFPLHRGELNYCLRGCYASVAKFKFPYRLAEAHVARAEKTDAVISAALDREPADLKMAWDALLFNAFHDILPGSSIERAYEDQLAWLGIARHDAHGAELRAINALAAGIDTTVTPPPEDQPSRVPFLVWNPHPHPYRGPVEVEVSADYRPVWTYTDRPDAMPVELLGPDRAPVPFQRIRTEHSSMPEIAWRVRAVFRAELPPLGWAAYEFGLAEDLPPAVPAQTQVTATEHSISNGPFIVSTRPGRRLVEITHHGKSLFPGRGLSVIRVDDPWGSWGGMKEEPDATHLENVLERWRVKDMRLLEAGPERASLWVRFAGGNSRLDLTFSLTEGRQAVDVHARAFWNERSSRLKLVFPAKGDACYDVPGGTVERAAAGEVPGGRWVRVGQGKHAWGFASNALYNFEQVEGAFRPTVVRASRYANDVRTTAGEHPWMPAVDAGELCFKFMLTPDLSALPRLAEELEQPPLVQTVVPSPGSLPRSGSLLVLDSDTVELRALKPAEDGQGWIIRLQETAGQSQPPLTGLWQGESLSFGELRPWGLHTYRLSRKAGKWTVRPTDLLEGAGV